MASRYRRKIFNDGILSYIEEVLKKIMEYYPEIRILDINHDRDHVHMLVRIPPKMSVGSAVRIIKSNTAKNMRKKFPFLKKVYFDGGGIWSGGYCVSTVGLDEKFVKNYIDMQGQEDAGQAKLEM